MAPWAEQSSLLGVALFLIQVGKANGAVDDDSIFQRDRLIWVGQLALLSERTQTLRELIERGVLGDPLFEEGYALYRVFSSDLLPSETAVTLLDEHVIFQG